MTSREQIINEARSWLGTPYLHQASVKQAGCDCLGLVRGIWRTFYGPEPREVEPYTPDWAERSGRETLVEAARESLTEIALSSARSGDVLIFRMAPDAPAKHCAILSAPDRIIHAYWGRAVTESFLIPYWQRRRAYAFSFPEISCPASDRLSE